jgi:hypothetical protein
VRSRATRGTINLGRTQRGYLRSRARFPLVCAGVVFSELLGSGSSSLLRQDFLLLRAAAARASAVRAQVAVEAAYEAAYED